MKVKAETLLAQGYTIENVKITDADLTMADHGVLVPVLTFEGNGLGGGLGSYVIGKGYLGAEKFEGYAKGIEYIMRVMDVVGVENFNQLKGKYARFAYRGWGSDGRIIGNIIADKWLDTVEFFREGEKEVSE